MRLTIFLIVFSVAAVIANTGHSQEAKITLQLKNATLSDVLNAIENNSSYYFMLNNKLIDLSKKIDIDVQDKMISEILTLLSEKAGIKYKIYDRQIVLSPRDERLSDLSVSQQQKSVSGKVTDASGAPLPGVSVVVKGTTTGVITDMDGKYTLTKVPESAILQFSFVGMRTQEFSVGSKTVINVTLNEETVGIEEVVAVGYGTQKKSDITGSVSSFKADKLEQMPTTNLAQSLQGAIAGVNITNNSSDAEGSGSTMLIRGQNSITAQANPLVILDGVPFGGSLSEIQPNDIASLEILKDASSAAIYGARAANGVILITTKKGKEGKFLINYDGYYGIDQIAHLPDMMDGPTFFKSKVDRFGLTSGNVTASEIAANAAGQYADWLDLATRNGSQQQHNLSFSGGTDKTKFFVSTSYNSVKGIALNDKFDRYMFRINLDQKFGEWVDFGTNTQFGYFDRSGQSPNFADAFLMNPLSTPYNADGSPTVYPWPEDPFFSNPLEATLYANSDISKQFISNNFVMVRIPWVKGLSYKINTGYTTKNTLYQNYRGRNTKLGYEGNGISDVQNTYFQDLIVENIVNYEKEIGLHRLNFTGLYSAQQTESQYHSLQGKGFPNDVMTYYQSNKATLLTPLSTYTKQNYISQMARVNYSFNSRYMLTMTIRRDGYSAFGNDKKFAAFKSAAVAWNAQEESFLKKLDWLSQLKLRISYGENGNQAVNAYSTLPKLNSIDYLSETDLTLAGFYPSQLGNADLGWETTKSVNTGLDFGFFKGRIMGTIDVYNTNTTDLLLNRTISPINGTVKIMQNIGQTRNHGLEMQLSTVNMKTSDFKWATDLTFSTNRNEIVNVGLTDANGKYIDDVANKWFIGKPINVNFEYVYDGIYQTAEEVAASAQPTAKPGDVRVLDANGDKKIDANDRQIIGSLVPDFIAGLTNTLSYKNFSLSFFLHAVQGINKPNDIKTTSDWTLRRRPSNVQYWTAENPNTDFPRNAEGVNPYLIRWYEDASFIRLKEVTLSYKFPQDMIKAAHLNRAEIFINGKNLYTFTKWGGMDPEFSSQLSAPLMRTVMVGVKLGF